MWVGRNDRRSGKGAVVSNTCRGGTGQAGLELYLQVLYLHMLCFVILFSVTLYSVVQERVSI